MRLTRRHFAARVKLKTGPRPVLLSFGLVTFECELDEAPDFAEQLVEAIDRARRGGYSEC